MSVASDMFFGLTTAFGYGSGDFLARQASHRVGHVPVLFYKESLGMLVLLPVALWFERDLWQSTDPWALIAILGGINVLASFFLYKSFEYGVLSVVSPLASSYPAVTAVLAFAFLGERPGGLATAGIAVVLLGIVLLSRSRGHPENPPPRDARIGLLSALLAFAGYGILYFALDYAVEDLGPITSAASVRIVGTGLLLLFFALGRVRLGRPPRSLWPTLAPIGVLNSIALIAYNVGIIEGSVAIVGTLSGLFSAVTVALAAVVLRERLTAPQYLGIGAVFFGVILMAVR